MNNIIKVLIVDDSIFFRKVLTQKLSENNNIEVIGYAVDAFDAQNKIPLLKPDVVTLDVEMPRLNGIEFLKKLIPTAPIPVVLVSSLNINVFDALSAGAVDFVRKPDTVQPNAMGMFIKELTAKIVIASNANVRPTVRQTQPIAPPAPPKPAVTSYSTPRTNSFTSNSLVIAIGASTGGTEATLMVLKDLPPDTPGILVTQHMPPGFTKMYAERLNRLCKMEVKEAQNGDVVRKGLVLIAPGDLHMTLSKQGTNYVVKCFDGDKVSGHRPSVDVLFSSVADVAKKNAIGVIMTGMGKDGADGLLKMKNQGAYTIGQDKDSCVVYGMPMVAYNLGAVTVQSSCQNISSLIQKHISKLSNL